MGSCEVGSRDSGDLVPQVCDLRLHSLPDAHSDTAEGAKDSDKARKSSRAVSPSFSPKPREDTLSFFPLARPPSSFCLQFPDKEVVPR